ncbi:Uncharacterised protein [Vibrio cholerae]|nr:Uncharacterised protein [Vibrio cholerae]
MLRDYFALFEPIPNVNRVDLMSDTELLQIVVALVKASKSTFNGTNAYAFFGQYHRFVMFS